MITRGFIVCALCVGVCGSVVAQQQSLPEMLSSVSESLIAADRALAKGDIEVARNAVLTSYLDQYEVVEGYYGASGVYATKALGDRITATESVFHSLFRATSQSDVQRLVGELKVAIDQIARAAPGAGVPLVPVLTAQAVSSSAGAPVTAQSKEVRGIIADVDASHAAWRMGDRSSALALLERAYLEGFEPLESRLPASVTTGVERLIHLQLRPALKREGLRDASVDAAYGSLRQELARADASIAGGASFMFGALNSFIIMLREGIEAVLLVGALLAYMNAVGASQKQRRQIFNGVYLGVAASLATWFIARTVLPISGSNRELVEGITAIIAVAVMLYVSHWLFQKTYIHDWKSYLREHLGQAVGKGSLTAMAGLAFAAVYREGFETVLFYQALMFDSGGASVLAGFIPGLIAVLIFGYAIIKAGVKLPLKAVFATTNAIIVYLAIVFLGKGIYNLQESGLFAAHPLTWLPDNGALRQVLGFYPLAETLIAQLCLIVLLAVTLIAYRTRQRYLQRMPAQGVAA